MLGSLKGLLVTRYLHIFRDETGVTYKFQGLPVAERDGGLCDSMGREMGVENIPVFLSHTKTNWNATDVCAASVSC